MLSAAEVRYSGRKRNVIFHLFFFFLGLLWVGCWYFYGYKSSSCCWQYTCAVTCTSVNTQSGRCAWVLWDLKKKKPNKTNHVQRRHYTSTRRTNIRQKKQMQREQSQQALKPQLMWSYRSYNLAKNDRKKNPQQTFNDLRTAIARVNKSLYDQ